MKISTGRVLSPIKTVIYGPEGIGKSTFAAAFPGAIFIDTEGSTKHMANVARYDDINSWKDILDAVTYTIAHIADYQTIVVDTADWAEMMCVTHVCRANKVGGIEDIGYGKGYVYLAEEFKKLLDMLEEAVNAGLNVVITAHAKMRKFEQPDEMGAYDRWEMKLSRQVGPMLKEWADMVLFANYKTLVITDDKTKSKKAQGGKRVMYTEHHPCWDAKNRFGLEECLPFDFAQIKDIVALKASALGPIGSVQETKKAPDPAAGAPADTVPFSYHSLKKLMDEARITDEEMQAACVGKGLQPDGLALRDYPEDFIEAMLIDKFTALSKYIKRAYSDVPFIKHWEDKK